MPGRPELLLQGDCVSGVDTEPEELNRPAVVCSLCWDNGIESTQQGLSTRFLRFSGLHWRWEKYLCLGCTLQTEGSGEGTHCPQTSSNTPPSGDTAVIVVQSLSRVRLFATPWTAACQASLSFTISWSLLKLMSIELVMPSNHHILCHSFLLLPSIFPSIRVFSGDGWTPLGKQMMSPSDTPPKTWGRLDHRSSVQGDNRFERHKSWSPGKWRA